MHCEGDLSGFKWKTHHKTSDLGRGFCTPRPWEISRASGDVFPNTSLLSAVYGYNTSLLLALNDERISNTASNYLKLLHSNIVIVLLYCKYCKVLTVSKYCQDPEDVSLLADCCKAADNCCSKIEKLTNVTKSFIASNSSTLDLVGTWNSDLVGSCPATWDGWQCWDPGHPGKNSSKYIIHNNHQHHHSLSLSKLTSYP